MFQGFSPRGKPVFLLNQHSFGADTFNSRKSSLPPYDAVRAIPGHSQNVGGVQALMMTQS